MRLFLDYFRHSKSWRAYKSHYWFNSILHIDWWSGIRKGRLLPNTPHQSCSGKSGTLSQPNQSCLGKSGTPSPPDQSCSGKSGKPLSLINPAQENQAIRQTKEIFRILREGLCLQPEEKACIERWIYRTFETLEHPSTFNASCMSAS